jgi:hypothetical protein
VDELLMHLFKAYEQVQYQQFCRYVKSMRDRYDVDVEDITAAQLMRLAVNKFDLLTQQNAMPSDGVEKVVALQAKVNDGSNTSTINPRARGRNSQDAWKKVAPKPGKPKTKLFNSKP